MADIARPCDEMAADGLSWVSSLSNEDSLRAAAHHEMVLSATATPRLDDLSEVEEASCWRTAFARAGAYGNPAPKPVDEARLSASDPAFVSKFRSLRADMKAKHGADVGFSILPVKPSSDLQNATFVLQVWTPQVKCAYGLTNMLRVMNGLRDKPYDWPVANLDRHFLMERKS